jgi:hypothetical protein
MPYISLNFWESMLSAAFAGSFVYPTSPPYFHFVRLQLQGNDADNSITFFVTKINQNHTTHTVTQSFIFCKSTSIKKPWVYT